MYISQESAEQTQERLLRVLARADLRVFPGHYEFVEYVASAFPAVRAADALAFVRDEQVWSVLVPAQAEATEPLGLFAFHFPPALDNSGFVGWLASHLKMTLGTGVLVICGQNSARGGIFDYWGVPASLVEAAVAEIYRLRAAAA